GGGGGGGGGAGGGGCRRGRWERGAWGRVMPPIGGIGARRRGRRPGSREAGNDSARGAGKRCWLHTASPCTRPSHDRRWKWPPTSAGSASKWRGGFCLHTGGRLSPPDHPPPAPTVPAAQR